MILTEKQARKVIEVIDCGLVRGMGTANPGKTCIEGAISIALDLPFNDHPACVGIAVAEFKIRLNDCPWSSCAARAAGMKKVGLAQLGSNKLDQIEFSKLLALKTVTKGLPVLLRLLAKNSTYKKDKYEKLAVQCETATDLKSAKFAANVATATTTYAHAAKYAVAFADATVVATTAVKVAAVVKYAAAFAIDADVVNAAVVAKYKPDFFYRLMADICLEVLIEMKSPGCKWLYLCV